MDEAELNNSSIYIHLPVCIQQTNYTCGAAALRSIARYFGRDLKNEQAFATLCASGVKKGTHPADLVSAAQALGFEARQYKGMSLRSLTGHIRAKRPVICAIQAGGTLDGYAKIRDGHYVVAIGCDRRNIYFHDPSTPGTRTYLARKEFMARWVDKEAYTNEPAYRQLGIVITSPDDEESRIQVIGRVKRMD